MKLAEAGTELSLPARIPPSEGEMLRTYLVRLATANHLPVSAVHDALGLPNGKGTLGIELTERLSRNLQRVASLTTDEVVRLHPDQERIQRLAGGDRSHPTRVRACPRCIVSTGVWQRRWVDPLQAVCGFHDVLLVEHDHEGQQLSLKRVEVMIRDTPWARLVRDVEPDFELRNLQHALDMIRMRHDPTRRHHPEDLILRYLLAFRNAEARSQCRADGVTLERLLRPEIERFRGLGYERPLDLKAGRSAYDGEQSLWVRVEHLALLLPTIVAFCQEYEETGSDDAFEDAREALLDIDEHATSPSPAIVRKWRGFVIQAPKRDDDQRW